MLTFNPSQTILMANAHDTLKNDDYETVTVVVPGGVSVAGNDHYIVTNDLTIGEAGSVMDVRLQTSRDTSRDYLATVQLGFTRTGSLGTYTLYADAYHVSAGVVRVQAFIPNPYGSSMTGQSGDETITFKIRTFKAPF